MTARVASILSLVLGVATGAYVLFGPTVTRCSFPTIGQTGVGQPVVTLAPGRCDTVALVQAQPVWPMPLLAIAVWSFAPVLAVAGVWTERPSLVALAFAVEATSIVSFGAGPYYIPFVALPLAVTWLLRGREPGRI